MNEAEISEQIDKHFAALSECLFGIGEPQEALDHLNKVQDLAKHIPGRKGDFRRDFFDAMRKFAEGFLLLGKGGDLEAALSHCLEARRIIQALKESYPEFTDERDFRAFELNVKERIVQIQMGSLTLLGEATHRLLPPSRMRRLSHRNESPDESGLRGLSAPIHRGFVAVGDAAFDSAAKAPRRFYPKL